MKLLNWSVVGLSANITEFWLEALNFVQHICEKIMKEVENSNKFYQCQLIIELWS